MGDREVIKALEKELKTSKFIRSCQDEDIRKLKDKCKSLRGIIDDKNYLIKRLQYKVDKIPCLIESAKAEALKEFGEKLKIKLWEDCPTITDEESEFSGYDIYETDKIINTLIKEMAGNK